MNEQQPVRRVEISFVGSPPLKQVERAPGVSEVELDGSLLRCLVTGSFQPFLEALRGHVRRSPLEALREVWRGRRVTIDEIDHYARICRVERVMRPYLEALTA